MCCGHVEQHSGLVVDHLSLVVLALTHHKVDDGQGTPVVVQRHAVLLLLVGGVARPPLLQLHNHKGAKQMRS